MKIIIVDPSVKGNIDKKTNSYWNQLKSLSDKGEDILFINATFSEFAEIIPDLKSLTPAERIVQSIKSITGEQ